MKTPGRLLTAMVTPFDEKGRVNYEQAKKLALALLDFGSQGLVVAGTTGESSTLTFEEELRLFTEIKEAVRNRGNVVAGTGSNNTAEAIVTTQAAEKVGVDACLLVVPYYNKPTQAGLYQHFEAIAKSTSLPCILYNVPSRTVTNLEAKTVIKLSKIDNIIGVKEASGNMEQVAQIIRGARKGFLVWSGNDSDTLPVLRAGGYGAISVASHLVGKQIDLMIYHHLHDQGIAATNIDLRLAPLFKALFLVSNPILIKHALNYLGFYVGKPRLPLTEPDKKTARALIAELKKHNIDLSI